MKNTRIVILLMILMPAVLSVMAGELNCQLTPGEDLWWRSIDDELLHSLIDKAERNNNNVQIALKRISKSRAGVGAARSGYYPQVGVSSGWVAGKESGITTAHVLKSTHNDYFTMGLTMNWEIDLFGRISEKLKGAKAAESVSCAEYTGVIVTLCANIAKDYVELRTYQQQYEIACRNIATQDSTLHLTKARYEAGLGNMLEVTQAMMQLNATKATLPTLEYNIRSLANTISVLVGEYPEEIVPELLEVRPIPRSLLRPPEEVSPELVRRRPDVMEAEMQVAEYAAQLGLSKKDYLPTFTLTGSIGTSSRKLSGLFGKGSMDYSVSPTVTWTLFDGLSRRYSVAEARLQMEASMDNYNQVLLTAVEEVENSMENYRSIEAEQTCYETLVRQSNESLQLALNLYRQGLTDFSNVVTAQQNCLDYMNSLISTQGSSLIALINIYEALGGGY